MDFQELAIAILGGGALGSGGVFAYLWRVAAWKTHTEDRLDTVETDLADCQEKQDDLISSFHDEQHEAHTRIETMLKEGFRSAESSRANIHTRMNGLDANISELRTEVADRTGRLDERTTSIGRRVTRLET